MGIRSPREIYTIIENHLREAEAPLTVVDLMEKTDVHQEAENEFGKEKATERLSDTLGFMWRRGLLTRYPAPRTEKSFARFAYAWSEKEDSRPVVIQPKIKTKSRAACTISEENGEVTIEFEKFFIVVKPR